MPVVDIVVRRKYEDRSRGKHTLLKHHPFPQRRHTRVLMANIHDQRRSFPLRISSQLARLGQEKGRNSPFLHRNFHCLLPRLGRVPRGFTHQQRVFGQQILGLILILLLFLLLIHRNIPILIFIPIIQPILGRRRLFRARQPRRNRILPQSRRSVPILDDAVAVEGILDFHSRAHIVDCVFAKDFAAVAEETV